MQQSGNLVTREYFLLPRDIFGVYLGPVKARHVDFVLDSGPGTFVTAVVDYFNGYYARRLQYDRTPGEPVVTPIVHGKPITPPEKPLIPPILCLIIIIILLIIIVWLVWRARKK